MGDGRGAHRILVGKRERKRPLERTRRRWEDNIKMNLASIWEGVDWICLAEENDKWRDLVIAIRNFRFA